MATNVTIIYTGLVGDEIRKGMEIARYFYPRNSYVDSPVYTEGFENKDQLGDKESYGKSIYATNVEGFGELPGLAPMFSNCTKFAEFERAYLAAKAAEEAGEENTGITFSVDGYQEELYWIQQGRAAADYFYTKVGDEEFGTKPESDGGNQDP